LVIIEGAIKSVGGIEMAEAVGNCTITPWFCEVHMAFFGFLVGDTGNMAHIFPHCLIQPGPLAISADRYPNSEEL